MAKKPQPQIEHRLDLETTSSRAMALREAEMTPENKSLLIRLSESEMEQLVLTARRYPRKVERARDCMIAMASLDEQSAAEMNYALPRGGKTVEGPSIRFAEVALQSWGNARAGARVIEVNRVEKYVEAEGRFWDLETNVEVSSRVRRRISDKEGRCFNDDMIAVTGNAATSIAKRNAILAGIPKAAWRHAYEASRKVAAGEIEALPKKRRETLVAFQRFGVGPDRVLASLGLQREEAISLDHIATLRGMWAALKNGEATVEEMFGGGGAIEHKPAAKKKAASLDELAAQDDEGMANLEAQRAKLAKARDDGLMGFHKGLTQPPAKYAGDPELSREWMAGWHEAESASDLNEGDSVEQE